MAKILDSINNIRLFDDLARLDSPIHRLHPVVKLLTTMAYLAILVSFDRHEVLALVPMALFPLILILVAKLPVGPLIGRLLVVEPLIVGVGILNPLFDPNGWMTFGSIMIKSTLCVLGALILVATTGMDKLAWGLKWLKVPEMFVLQLTLTYRYIFVLIEELVVMLRAYTLRSYKTKGIRLKDSGPFVGQLLLRTLDRAKRVYDAMLLRGFQGNYPGFQESSMAGLDLAFGVVWVAFFLAVRFSPWLTIVLQIGKGGFK